MEKRLPKGWSLVQLEDLSESKYYAIGDGDHGQIKPAMYRDSGVPYIRVGDMGWGTFSEEKLVYISNEVHQDNLKSELLPGDVLIAKTGATIGKCCIVPESISKANTTSSVGKVSLNLKLTSSKFILYYFLSPGFYKMMWSYSNRTAQPGFNNRDLKIFPVPLPPKAEQERIVAKLDILFAEIERVKEGLAKIPVLMKNFRQAVLNQAVTGKLTEEWRKGKELGDVEDLLNRLNQTREILIKDKKVREVKLKDTDKTDNLGVLPNNWKKSSLYNLANIIDPNPSHRMPIYYDEGIPFISTENIINYDIDFRKGKKVGVETLKEQIKRFSINDGDFIYTRIGTIGKSCYLPIERNFCISHAVCIISSYDKLLILPEFLRIAIGSEKIIEQGLHGVQSVGVPDLGMGKIRCFQIPVCSVVEQQEIVRRVEALFAQAHAIEARYEQLKEKIEQLPQAILAKAFRGELVPQDPNDEPADKLLERIKALKSEAESMGKKMKNRKEKV